MKEGGRLDFFCLLLFICFHIFDIQKLHQIDVGGGEVNSNRFQLGNHCGESN